MEKELPSNYRSKFIKDISTGNYTITMRRYLKVNKMKYFFLLILFTPYFVTAQNKQAGVSVSPYSIAIKQPDGSSLRIIGKVDQHIPYTETEDGYTLLKNDQKFYVYAKKGSGGNLKSSGIIAKDASKRSRKEKKILDSIAKHLRYESPYLESIQKKMGSKPFNK
ncbi:MAG: hypothetical protein M3142_08415 [Bacteroidota bacterium]|nr:hypothetical protein [Bacteroidota bacterium]